MEDGVITMEGPPGEIVERLTGTKEKNRMYPGLPSAVRIFGELRKAETGERTDVSVRAAQLSSLPLPLRAGEGRNLMRQLLGDQKTADGKAKENHLEKREAVLSAKELWFHYQQEDGTTGEVLRGLSLTLYKGELLCLLGGNGAGKTTTLRMLSGLLQPTGGEADILGFRLTQQPQEIKRRINLSPQETAVAPNLTVRENLELIAGIYGASRREAAQRAAETIAEFHLGEVERSRAKTLSGGWRRRLSIAMALISQPQLVFLDEPTLGLDVLARRELWQVIRSLRGRVTVILTTHYLEEAEALSDRIGILSHGRLRICGTAQELCAAAGETRFEEAFIKLAGEGVQ